MEGGGGLSPRVPSHRMSRSINARVYTDTGDAAPFQGSSPLFHAYDGKATAVFVDSECKVLDRVRWVRRPTLSKALALALDRRVTTPHTAPLTHPPSIHLSRITLQGQPRARPGAAARQLLLGQQRPRQQLGHGLRRLAAGAGEGGGALPLGCVCRTTTTSIDRSTHQH